MVATEQPKPGHPTNKMGKIAFAALSASSIENYDFFIYGTAAALVFPRIFFPNQSSLTGAMLSFATFAVGFVARPAGGILFGHIGDVYGRRRALIGALVGMGLATTLIGLLPPHQVIGIAAPLLLVVLRFLQGIALGGQQGGVVLLALENAPPRRRGFYSSFAQAGGPAGIILGNLAFIAVIRSTAPEAFESWGWRVPFLASAVLIALAIRLQFTLEETSAFQTLQKAKQEKPARDMKSSPALRVFRGNFRRIVIIAGAYIGINVTYYLFMTFAVSYSTSVVGISRDTVLLAVLVAAAVQLVMLPVAGAVSDRVGRRVMLLAGSGALAVWSFAFWPLLNTRSTPLIMIAFIVGLGLLHTVMYGPQGAFFAEAFSTGLRYSGFSLGLQLGSVLGGGLAPLIATSLFAATGTSLSVTAYMALVCAITFGAVLLMPETHTKDIDVPEEQHEQEAVHDHAHPKIG